MSKNGGFKLLAIRPLEGCDGRFLKVLTANETYQFYNDYKFKFQNDNESLDIIEIVPPKDRGIDLYGNEPFPINISAIVGKNGAGKSTLMELFFAGIYNLSVVSKIIEYQYWVEDKNERGGKKIQENKKFIELIPKIKLELFFELDEIIKGIRLDSDETEFFRDLKMENVFFNIMAPKLKPNKVKLDLTKIVEKAKGILQSNFFYTIAVNH